MLLDASALLNIVRLLGLNALNYIKGRYVLTLTLYEIGNAIWKEVVLLKRLKLNEALTLLKLFMIVYRHLNVVSPKDVTTVLDLACRLRITYYDASYVVVAAELDVPLVTDDLRLKRRIKEGENIMVQVVGKKVEVLTSNEYVGKGN